MTPKNVNSFRLLSPFGVCTAATQPTALAAIFPTFTSPPSLYIISHNSGDDKLINGAINARIKKRRG
jgi:hypothetical protein